MMDGIAAPDEYRTLLTTYLPRTITSEAEAADVQRVIDDLIDKDDLSVAETDFLSLLGDLTPASEGNRDDLPDISGVEAIRELLKVRGERPADLVGPVFSTRSVASEVLSGKRPLSYKTVEKLAGYFHVSPALFYPAPADAVGRAEEVHRPQ